MVRELILTSAIFVSPASCSANDKLTFEPDPEVSARAIFDGFSGASLVIGTKKACEHIKSNLNFSSPGHVLLLMSSEDFSFFYEKKCEGKCDMVEVSNIIAECKIENRGKQCVWYAAILDKRIYTLSFDPTIQSIEGACFHDGN
jgi:hypothetical protein